MIRLGLYVVALFFTLLGCALFLSPVPGGIVVLFLGVAMMVTISPTAQNWLRLARARSHTLNLRLHQLEHRLEKRIRIFAHALIATRPAPPDPKTETVELKTLD